VSRVRQSKFGGLATIWGPVPPPGPSVEPPQRKQTLRQTDTTDCGTLPANGELTLCYWSFKELCGQNFVGVYRSEIVRKGQKDLNGDVDSDSDGSGAV